MQDILSDASLHIKKLFVLVHILIPTPGQDRDFGISKLFR